MQALLPSQVPSGSVLAQLRQQELATLQGTDKGPTFEPKLWDRVYQVSHQVWQSMLTMLAALLLRRLDACCLQHTRLLAVQPHWDHRCLLQLAYSTVFPPGQPGTTMPALRPER